jgi:hypothetical protein
MAQLLADRRDIDFALGEQFQAEELVKYERYRGLNKKAFDMIISEARKFAVNEILPTYAEGDRIGAVFEDGQVKVPECYRQPFRLFREGEWSSLAEDPEVGGQGLPHLINVAAREYLVGANFAFSSYTALGHGTGKMIEVFGSEKQKKLFLKKLYTAEWGGTMLLTEPEAGSDVGALTTSARKIDDGTYLITGNKIFITAGEHDLTENIIHPVLARIEGAPSGSRGISVFIVPKIWVNDDGSLGEPNDVVCTGIEEKMGLHGSATCSMTLGGKGNCRGLLLGEEHKGMRVMFHMMNEARLGVGAQAFMHASAAYLYALNYARERRQGRALENLGDSDAPQVPIIQHPDVRRMLLWMKAYVEGMRSFVYYVARCFDKVELSDNAQEKEKFQNLIELLTPVLKTYNAKYGFEVCVQAIQIYGGYGYIKDYPVEQLARDCKIASIYEGTDGIQAMDLIGRKLGMKEGAVFLGFLKEIQNTIAQAKTETLLERMATDMQKSVERLGEVALHTGKLAMSPEFKVAFAHSVPFLEVMGDVTMAWMLLWRATVAAAKLKKGPKNVDAVFYEGQIKTAEFFFETEMPITFGKMDAILGGCGCALEISEEAYGGR